jgi:diguanylate cyclase (GGDEF)-like protein
VAFTVLVLVTPVAVYDFIFEYLRLVLILGAVISLLFIATHPIFKRHKGYPYLVLAGLIVLLTAVSDTLREYDYLQTPELMSFGFTCFIMIQALFLAWNFNSAYKRSSRLAGENAQMLEQITALNLDLETRIRARTVELERMNKRFEEMSKLDPLTNLPNRRYFEERFTQEWFRAERTQQPLAILMIDIDFFKKYNDTFGHVKGDDCLIDVTVAIKETLSRGGDFLARYGGEEFIVLLPDTNLTGAYVVGENICKAVLAKQFEHPDSELSPFVTVSVGGTAVLCNGPSQMESIINTADQALYNAKNTGRNRVVVRSFSYAHSLDPQ